MSKQWKVSQGSKLRKYAGRPFTSLAPRKPTRSKSDKATRTLLQQQYCMKLT